MPKWFNPAILSLTLQSEMTLAFLFSFSKKLARSFANYSNGSMKLKYLMRTVGKGVSSSSVGFARVRTQMTVSSGFEGCICRVIEIS
jgi:hypothetical protein